jgi:hypothetical protein
VAPVEHLNCLNFEPGPPRKEAGGSRRSPSFSSAPQRGLPRPLGRARFGSVGGDRIQTGADLYDE